MPVPLEEKPKIPSVNAIALITQNYIIGFLDSAVSHTKLYNQVLKFSCFSMLKYHQFDFSHVINDILSLDNYKSSDTRKTNRKVKYGKEM